MNIRYFLLIIFMNLIDVPDFGHQGKDNAVENNNYHIMFIISMRVVVIVGGFHNRRHNWELNGCTTLYIPNMSQPSPLK